MILKFVLKIGWHYPGYQRFFFFIEGILALMFLAAGEREDLWHPGHSFLEVALDSAEASLHNCRAHSKHKNVVVGIYQLKTILDVLQNSTEQKPVKCHFQLATCCHRDSEPTSTIPYRGLDGSRPVSPILSRWNSLTINR